MSNRDPERGARLIQAMRSAGVLVGELAKECNRSSPTISNWRQGAEMPLELAVVVCARLGCSLDWFLTGKEAQRGDQRLLSEFYRLSARQRRLVRELIREMIES